MTSANINKQTKKKELKYFKFVMYFHVKYISKRFILDFFFVKHTYLGPYTWEIHTKLQPWHHLVKIWRTRNRQFSIWYRGVGDFWSCHHDSKGCFGVSGLDEQCLCSLKLSWHRLKNINNKKLISEIILITAHEWCGEIFWKFWCTKEIFHHNKYYKISLKNRYTNGQKFLKECSFLWTFYVFASLRNILSV